VFLVVFWVSKVFEKTKFCGFHKIIKNKGSCSDSTTDPANKTCKIVGKIDNC